MPLLTLKTFADNKHVIFVNRTCTFITLELHFYQLGFFLISQNYSFWWCLQIASKLATIQGGAKVGYQPRNARMGGARNQRFFSLPLKLSK